MYPVVTELPGLNGATFSLGSYALCLIAAMLLAFLIMQRAGRGVLPTSTWLEFAAGALVCGLLGAKLLHLVVLLAGGMPAGRALASAALSAGVWLGGVALCALWVAHFVRREGIDPARLVPVVMLALPLAHALGRIGCWLAGCCFGAPTEMPWAITYQSAPAADIHGTPIGVPMHPVPLYEAGLELLNAAVLWLLYRRGAGLLLVPCWLLLYGLERFALEFFRADPRGALGPLATSQWLGLLMIAVGLVWLISHCDWHRTWHHVRHGRIGRRPTPAGLPLVRSAAGGLLLVLALPAWSGGSSGTGWFFNGGPSIQELNATDVVLIDVDGDLDLDAVVAYSWRLDTVSGNFVTLPNLVLINSGGEFFQASSFAGDVPTEAIAAGDVDGDGDSDLLLGNGYLPDDTGGTTFPDQLWLNDGSGNFTAGTTFGTGTRSDVLLVDVDADLDLDMVVQENAGSVAVRLNQGAAQGGTEGTFGSPTVIFPTSAGDIVDIGVAPIDNNASPDLYLALGQGQDEVWFNNGSGMFTDSMWRIPGDNRTAIMLGNLDGDADVDLVALNSTLLPGSVGIQVFTNVGTQFFPTGQAFEPGLYLTGAIADIDGDSDGDLLVGEEGLGGASMNVFLNNGANTLRHSTQCFAYQENVTAIAVGDLNGDMAVDAFVAGQPVLDQNDVPLPGQPVTTVWFNNGPINVGYCCPFEFLNELTLFPFRSETSTGGPLAWIKGVGDGLADLALLDRIRDQQMAGRIHGDRYINHFYDFGLEIVQLFQSQPDMHDAASDRYLLWQPALEALDAGNGGSELVSAAMVQALDDFLSDLSAAGGPALQQMIADERALLPPFSSFIGLTIEQFRDLTMGPEGIFIDSFEAQPREPS